MLLLLVNTHVRLCWHQVGEDMLGFVAGKVLESKSPRLATGDFFGGVICAGFDWMYAYSH